MTRERERVSYRAAPGSTPRRRAQLGEKRTNCSRGDDVSLHVIETQCFGECRQRVLVTAERPHRRGEIDEYVRLNVHEIGAARELHGVRRELDGSLVVAARENSRPRPPPAHLRPDAL